MEQKREFFFAGSLVGYFQETGPLRIPGRNAYMPYRGPGHLHMVEAVRRGEHPRCTLDSGSGRSFIVIDVPEQGVVELDAIEDDRPLSGIALARMVEMTEAVAYADLLRAAPADWHCVAEETDAGWLLLAPALDILLFNRIVGCGLQAPARHADLRALIARFQSAGVRNYGVQLSPAAEPGDVGSWLADAGLSPRDRWTKVYRAADAPGAIPATDLRIEPAGREQATVFAELTTTGFGMPPALRPWIASTVGRPQWSHYIAWNGNEPVAAAALFVHGDVGWLGVASTLPAARRRGAQGALMARRMEDGRKLGCRWFVTETGEDIPARPNPSFHNMMRAGFTVAYHRPNLMPAKA